MLNRPTSITDPRGGATAFGYDPNGNLRTLTDARGKATTWDYDDMDRVEKRTDPLTRFETFDYDDAGNLTRYTDRENQVTTFGYDDLGRREFAGFGATGTPPNESYVSTIDYDFDTGNRLWRTIDSTDGTITLGYDELDRLTSETNPRGSITYGYDDADRRESMTVAGQTAVTYTFDDADKLTQISQGSTTVGLTYDEAGRRSRLTLPNGITVDYGYDDASRLTSLTYKLGQTTLGDLAYAYDPAGQRTRVSGSYARSSIPAALSSAAYNDANELLTWAGTTISYDHNGNLTGDGSRTYDWNERNELQSLTGSPAASFSYDSFGRRFRKTVAGASTDFLYDGINVVQELSSGSPTANLISGGIDQVFLRTDATGARSFLADSLGSTIALADPSGTVQTSYTYEPFGKPSTTGQANANSFQFTGRETDGTGLLFYRARYHSPSFSRFASEDPIGFAGGDVNLHAHVRNSPLNYTDPSGTCPSCIAAGAGNLGAIGASLGAGIVSNWLAGRKLTYLGRAALNLPWTLLGLEVAKITGSETCILKPGLIYECYDNDVLPGGAITIGSTVITQHSEDSYGKEEGLRAHENRHVDQWAGLWPVFPLAYGAGAVVSVVTTGDLFCGNPLEQAAGKTAGYAHCGWP